VIKNCSSWFLALPSVIRLLVISNNLSQNFMTEVTSLEAGHKMSVLSDQRTKGACDFRNWAPRSLACWGGISPVSRHWLTSFCASWGGGGA
jgi:hypothetical protein